MLITYMYWDNGCLYRPAPQSTPQTLSLFLTLFPVTPSERDWSPPLFEGKTELRGLPANKEDSLGFQAFRVTRLQPSFLTAPTDPDTNPSST